MSALRVLVVDDHPLYREGLVTAMAAMPGVEVVGEPGDGHAAVEAARRLSPDVVVMDLHMPGLNGIDATRQVVLAQPSVAVLVLTRLDGDDSVFAAMRAGARGYLLKGADRGEIARDSRESPTARSSSAPGSPRGSSPSSRPGQVRHRWRSTRSRT